MTSERNKSVPQADGNSQPPNVINIVINNGRGGDEDNFPFRPEVADFAVEMETQLCMNDHKGGWGGLTIEELLRHVDDEVGELKAAIRLRLSPEEISRECADAANFLMMLAENYADEHTDGRN